MAHAAADAQVLTVSGDRLAVDGEARFLIFVSYFDGLRRANANGGSGDLDTDFAYLQRIGVDGIRMLPNWQYPCASGPTDDAQKLLRSDGTIAEGMWPVFTRLLDRAAAHRLVVDLTFTRDTYESEIPVAAYQKALASVAARLRGRYPHLLFDVQNEYPIHGLTPADVRGILGAIRAADPSRIVTASGGGGDILHDPAMNLVAYHDSREEDWHTAAAAQRQMAAVRKAVGPGVPVYFQEPMPFRKFHADCGHGEWPRAGFARRAAAHARRHGAAAWTFHSRQSFDLRERPLLEILKADAEQMAELEAAAKTP